MSNNIRGGQKRNRGWTDGAELGIEEKRYEKDIRWGWKYNDYSYWGRG
jgi:hypothetical protein